MIHTIFLLKARTDTFEINFFQSPFLIYISPPNEICTYKFYQLGEKYELSPLFFNHFFPQPEWPYRKIYTPVPPQILNLLGAWFIFKCCCHSFVFTMISFLRSFFANFSAGTDICSKTEGLERRRRQNRLEQSRDKLSFDREYIFNFIIWVFYKNLTEFLFDVAASVVELGFPQILHFFASFPFCKITPEIISKLTYS